MSTLPSSYQPRVFDPVVLSAALEDIAKRNAGHPVIAYYVYPERPKVRGAYDIIAEIEAGTEITHAIPIDLDRLPATSFRTNDGYPQPVEQVLAILHDANLI